MAAFALLGEESLNLRTPNFSPCFYWIPQWKECLEVPVSSECKRQVFSSFVCLFVKVDINFTTQASHLVQSMSIYFYSSSHTEVQTDISLEVSGAKWIHRVRDAASHDNVQIERYEKWISCVKYPDKESASMRCVWKNSQTRSHKNCLFCFPLSLWRFKMKIEAVYYFRFYCW